MYTRDPIWPNLSALAYGAQPMTDELWEAMQHGYRHAPIRPELRSPASYARIGHGKLPLYSRARKLS